MKAMYIDAPGQVSIKDVEMPVRKEGEVLLKILYGGICGSDLGSYRGTFAYFDYPRIPGHEFSAEVIEADENNAYGIKPGMIVTCNPYFNCGHCYSCEHGIVNAVSYTHLIDREILQILQHNARASLKMIAEKTFLSSPAVSARIEKLEKDCLLYTSLYIIEKNI